MSMNMDEHEHGDNEHVFSLVDHARHMQWLHGQNVTSCSLTGLCFSISAMAVKPEVEEEVRNLLQNADTKALVGSVRKIMQVLEHHGLACRQRLNCKGGRA